MRIVNLSSVECSFPMIDRVQLCNRFLKSHWKSDRNQKWNSRSRVALPQLFYSLCFGVHRTNRKKDVCVRSFRTRHEFHHGHNGFALVERVLIPNYKIKNQPNIVRANVTEKNYLIAFILGKQLIFTYSYTCAAMPRPGIASNWSKQDWKSSNCRALRAIKSANNYVDRVCVRVYHCYNWKLKTAQM